MIRRFAVLLLVPGIGAADPAGRWQSETSDRGRFVEVEIAPCGDALCGTIIVEARSPRRDSLIGRQMIAGMRPDGPDRWDGGTIWAPDEDETYDAKMQQIGPDRLKVSGCIAFGLICRGQVWTRVE